jgi:hypothetical protein
MMAKRANLAANVKAAAAADGEPPLFPELPAVPIKPKQSSRAGRKAIYAWIEPSEHLKLKRLALDTGRSVEALVTEGVGLVFLKHGL